MSSRPIVFLHGWGGAFTATFGDTWLRAIAEMEAEAITIDLPGHADPGASVDPEDYADLAATVRNLLPEVRSDLIGFSLGGKIALALALAEPARFGRMVLGGVGDNIFAPEPAAEHLADALAHGVEAATSDHVRAMVEYSQASGSAPLALAAVLRRPPNPCFTPTAVARLSVPTLVVNGTSDVIALPDGRFLAASPAISSIHLTGVGHVELPQEPAFVRQALSFLATGECSPATESFQ